MTTDAREELVTPGQQLASKNGISLRDPVGSRSAPKTRPSPSEAMNEYGPVRSSRSPRRNMTWEKTASM